MAAPPRKFPGRSFDWTIVFVTLALVAIGVAMVYSASHVPSSPARLNLWRSQLLWVSFGLVVAAVAAAVPYRLVEEMGHFFYAGSILLLLLVPVIGVSEYGAKRWLDLGGFNFQPSEPAKICTVIMVARFLDRRRVDLTRPAELLKALGLMTLPFFLILRQPDLGTSLSLPVATFAMLFWAGLPVALVLLFMTPMPPMWPWP